MSSPVADAPSVAILANSGNPTEIDLSDLEPISLPFNWAGKRYLLCEASGDAVCKYRNAIMKAAKPNADGTMTSAEGVIDTEYLLVSLCTFEIKTNPKDGSTSVSPQHVSEATVRSWPHRVKERLFRQVEQMSELGQMTEKQIDERIQQLEKARADLKRGKAEESLKNESSDTTDG